MVVLLGQMQLPAPQDPDPSDDYFNGTISGGGLWTALTRSSDHDHTGGVNGKPISIASIPDGSITTSKLDPSVLAPYSLVDGSKPFTGQVVANAGLLVRDTLYFGATPAGVGDVFWRRASATALRTDGNLGVGMAPAGWASSMRAVQVGGLGLMGAPADPASGNLLSNSVYDGTDFRALGAGAATRIVTGPGLFWLQTAPTVAAGAVQTFTTRLQIDPTGPVAVNPGVSKPWAGGVTSVQVGPRTHLAGGSNFTAATYNAYYDGAAYRLIGADAASRVLLAGAAMSLEHTGAAAAETAVTWVPRLSVSPNGTVTLNPDGSYPALTAAAGPLLISSPGYVVLSLPAAFAVYPNSDNAVNLGLPSPNRWAAVYAATGTIQTSSREAKTDVAPLDPAAALAAVRATDPVRFHYRPPERGPEWYELPDDPEQAEAILLQRLTAAPLEAGARHQAGFVLQDETGQYQTDPLFETGEGQSNAANSAGVLLAAIKALDTRLSALEGA